MWGRSFFHLTEKSQGNKGETIFREKERRRTMNHERKTGQLKCIEKQKGDRVN
jgi:hypothetical protein